MNIWENSISRREDSKFKALSRGFEKQQVGQSGWNRENEGEMIRDEVREVPKSDHV